MNNLTVNDYLDNLELDRQDMINSLKSKGMEISDSATFTEIVPKMDGLVDINGYYNLTKRTSGNFYKYIRQIPMIDTSGYSSLNDMFYGFESLITIPLLDTSNVTNMTRMFQLCKSLITIPLLDTSKVTSMENMFDNCISLTTIPLLNTNNVTNMRFTFYTCKNLITIPQLDTSKVTDMHCTFHTCENLTEIPQLNTSKVTNMNGTFEHCLSLTEIPQLDTSKVTRFSYMFDNCPKLTTIPQLDTSNVTNLNNAFRDCPNLTTLEGFTNLGKAYDTTQNANYSDYTLNLSDSNNLTHDSLMNVINNLYDIATKGCQPQKLVLGSTNLEKLTEEEIAIATNKGWNVVA